MSWCELNTEEFQDPFDDLINVTVPITKAAGNREYTYEGVGINFPYEAYPSQQQMMLKIIQGVIRSEHCLLESPTGTGKTAALLCSLLAWQGFDGKIPLVGIPPKKIKLDVQDGRGPNTDLKGAVQVNRSCDELYLQTASTDNDSSLTSNSTGYLEPGNTTPKVGKRVKIYYASRTLSQIKNVVKQLKETAYASTPMTILASRNQTCLNDLAKSDEASIDDMCDRLRNPPLSIQNTKRGERPSSPPPICEYFQNFEKIPKGGFDKFPSSRNNTPWDIEDIQKYGKSCKSCPYYGIRALQEDARIIFCTYNHLLHGHIRNASKIEINSNSIIVFDEAHNIEDRCMEIASRSITLDRIDMVRLEFDEAMKGTVGRYGDVPLVKKDALQLLDVALNRFSNWLADQNKKNAAGFEPKEFNFRGSVIKSTKDLTPRIIETFSSFGFGFNDLPNLSKAFSVMENKDQNFEPEEAAFRIDPKHMRRLGGLLYVLKFLFTRNSKLSLGDATSSEYDYIRLGDYKVFLVKLLAQQGPSDNKSNQQNQLELHLCCLNPALAFEPMKAARTVIVTSGTLSPIASFTSELQMEFKHVLSASHVLGPDRIFSAVITKSKESSKKSWILATNH